MGFLNKLFGYRWSLHIFNNGKLVYAMHEDAVLRMIGYFMSYYGNGGQPISPWKLILKFNRNGQTIVLGRQHFTSDGKDVTPLLPTQIEAIDPGWQVRGSEPVFEDVVTGKRLKIGHEEYASGGIDIHKMFADIGKPKDMTFYDLMDKVFGKQ